MAKQVNFNKKDIIFLVLIGFNLILTGGLFCFTYKMIQQNNFNTMITITKSDLIDRAMINCLKDTGGLECDYIKLAEEQALEYNQSLIE